jgi:biopolymer transport protein ExbB
VRRDLRTLENCPTLSQAHEQLRNGAFLMQAAGSEARLSASLRSDGLKERIAWQLERIEQAASRKMARGTGVLATIGSTAPFVGLFGTVWGIMDSFIGISKAHTTNPRGRGAGYCLNATDPADENAVRIGGEDY